MELNKYDYTHILSDEEKAWEKDHDELLKAEFQAASNAEGDGHAQLKHLESAFAKMEEMRKKLERKPVLYPAQKYHAHEEVFGAKQLCRLYMHSGRNEDAIEFASRCYSVARSEFFRNPRLDFPYYWQLMLWKYEVFKFWGEALGNFYIDDDQAYMAKHLWETILNDLKQVHWAGNEEENDKRLAQEQEIWRRKLNRSELKSEAAES